MSKRRNRARRERREAERGLLMDAANRTLELHRWPERYRWAIHAFANALEVDGVLCDEATEEVLAAASIVVRKLKVWPAIYAEAVSAEAMNGKKAATRDGAD